MTEALLSIVLEAAERGDLPDPAIQLGIRLLCRERLREQARQLPEEDFARRAEHAAVALLPETVNQQHYEVPPQFFEIVLGPTLKYSCCEWSDGAIDLAGAERSALSSTCQRAELENGQDVLELGCGWGSLALWMAECYPRSRVTAVSNSVSQREFILRRATQRGLTNLEVLTADMNVFDPARSFDRVVSVEMFEHMSNHGELMRRISSWLRPRGKLFVHLFCHRVYSYSFETEGASNWLGRHFFTGGLMPSEQLLPSYQDHLKLKEQWRWNGMHYHRTASAWLRNLDQGRDQALPILREVYGERSAERWFGRWRLFFLACAGLWGYRKGSEWGVAHYLFEKPSAKNFSALGTGREPSVQRTDSGHTLQFAR